MKLPLYQVDAFTDKIFAGNPAAVCPLEGEWLPDALMQQIGLENNLAETAFFLRNETGTHIRWFTPQAEVDLCGHATLASAFVLFHELAYGKESITFQSRSGPLTVTQEGGWLKLNFPADKVQKVPLNADLRDCFDKVPQEAFQGLTDYMLIYRGQEEIETIRPDLLAIKHVNARGIIVTSPGKECDFVSRFFAPAVGIDEDPVTGSAHTTLAPYWSARLGKKDLRARQLSQRGGELRCSHLGERVEISGQAVLYLKGEISL